MYQPYLTPHSLHTNAPPQSSSIPLYQYAGPAQTASQQRQEQQLQENISPQSRQSGHQSHVHNPVPSEQQHAAVLSLQSIPNHDLFGLLERFRRGETALYPDNLSEQQFQAFLALKDCPDELILTLQSFSGSLGPSQKFYDSDSLGNGRVAANHNTQSLSLVSNASTRDIPNVCSVQGSYNLSRDNSVGLSNSSAASSTEHDRWCFICENPTQPFRTADGFKRHLREHFKQYFCIPQQPLVDTEDGPKCTFCNYPDPDPIHLNTHVTGCVGRKFTRKSTLIKHLKKEHHIHDGSVLAGHSEYSIELKYFPCGFCVFCCGSLIELANHVDAHHYKVLQHIRHWDNEKVIRGLLSQPGVIECWQAILASNPPPQEPWLRRIPTLVEQLKRRLEMSREPAKTVCNAAIHASSLYRDWYGYPEPVPEDQGMVANQMIQPFERQDAVSLPSFNSEKSHIAYAPHTAAAFPQSQHPATGWDRLNHMDWNKGRHYPQSASETYELPPSTTYQHPSHGAHIFYPSKCESFMQYQYPAYSSSTASSSGTSRRASEDQAQNLYHLRLGGYSSDLSPNLAINPHSGHELETYTTPDQAHTGWNYPAPTMESVSSPLSRDHSISPLSHCNDTCNPKAHPSVAAHSILRKPTNRCGTDIDSDSDDQQRFTHAQGLARC